jgi:hypothetical protein
VEAVHVVSAAEMRNADWHRVPWVAVTAQGNPGA